MHRRVPAFRRPLLVLFGSLAAAGCGSHSNPTGPSPEPPSAPTILCPAPPAATSIDGGAVAVMFAPPLARDGAPPLTIACTPASGSPFPVGSSNVTCTVADASQRTASCSFMVMVVAAPRIAATRFVAYGDSLTEGKLSNGVVVSSSYPAVLKAQLMSRYAAQAAVIDVHNAGLGGETTLGARLRFRGEIIGYEVLLLLEGANDLNLGASVSSMVTNLRNMVRDAREHGLLVFVGTLLPERPGSTNGGAAAAIPAANDQIRAMAASEGAILVDLYQAFGGEPGSLIGDDGLHPTQEGYNRMADTFFGAIRDRLEVVWPVMMR